MWEEFAGKWHVFDACTERRRTAETSPADLSGPADSVDWRWFEVWSPVEEQLSPEMVGHLRGRQDLPATADAEGSVPSDIRAVVLLKEQDFFFQARDRRPADVCQLFRGVRVNRNQTDLSPAGDEVRDAGHRSRFRAPWVEMVSPRCLNHSGNEPLSLSGVFQHGRDG